MHFDWDEHKNQLNLRKHQVRFETAQIVFDDPRAYTRRDSGTDEEERWITVGSIGSGAILIVVHTYYQLRGEEFIRLISARPAETYERKTYEEIDQGPEKRHSRRRSNKRQGH
jgi:uncharacterized protein